MNWRDAVWAAVKRQALVSGGAFSRSELIDSQLAMVVTDAQSEGATPAQTMSRVLQELRDEGVVIFDGRGRYRLAESSAAEPDAQSAIRTQREELRLARVGQGRFRNGLEARWGAKCPLTQIADRQLLRASHIVAWGACTDEAERLNPENGLLLSALWDAAFDEGLVSFGDDGVALARRGISPLAVDALKASGGDRIDGLSAGNRERLAMHRHWCTSGIWPTA